ncbi:B12-binding domain-containing radical SAM protein [candidate division KSB1 bacterium]|nr:B12-binding domain-containing radical SAM protein [candidate division KSB1 bacterium]
MNKIVFIEPKSPNLHIFSQFLLPRLGVFILGAIVKEYGWDAEVIVEQSQKIDFENIANVDMIGISTITPTAPRAYAIADKIRALGIPVIMGGPHVTFLPDEALEHADYVIRGEAEEALISFIETWENGKDFSQVPNLSYQTDGKTLHNPMKPLSRSLDENPFPDFSLSQYVRNKIIGKTTIPVQTSRGCPFHCSFCSVTGMFGNAYRFRSTENIIEELYRYNHKKHSIFFYDDNFTANRRRAKALLRRMIEEKFKFRWSTQVRVDIAKDPELVWLMKKAGCHTVYIGMESVNPQSLKSMKKQQTVDEMAQAVKVLHRQGIRIHGMFVYGFDEDDWHTVKETVRFAKRAKLSSTQFLILTPLPGSKFYNQVTRENRIQFHDWALYDAHHAVFMPKRLSLFELQRAQIFSHSKFYSLVQVIRRALSFAWVEFAIAVYARKLNRLWQKKNKTFLRVMELCRTKKEAKIFVDYQELVRFEDEVA